MFSVCHLMFCVSVVKSPSLKILCNWSRLNIIRSSGYILLGNVSFLYMWRLTGNHMLLYLNCCEGFTLVKAFLIFFSFLCTTCLEKEIGCPNISHHQQFIMYAVFLGSGLVSKKKKINKQVYQSISTTFEHLCHPGQLVESQQFLFYFKNTWKLSRFLTSCDFLVLMTILTSL